jgi:dipeptidyl aminopeptidase/acylaminoacyl peptidase
MQLIQHTTATASDSFCVACVRYLDGLIGPWPEAEELYKQRSPLYAADAISAPVALFQVGGMGE